MSVKIPSLRELMSAGVHFGHVAKYWHPKMAPYIFTRRDRIHVLNLEKTQEALNEILPKITEFVSQGKNLLFVSTKKQVNSIVKEIGEETGVSFIVTRWLGGTLTNFEVMRASIKRMREIEEILLTEAGKKMIKKERLILERKLARMKEKFEGLKNLVKVPDAIFIIDPHHEVSAVKEAKILGITIFAIADSNSDPTGIDYLIPANDDAKKSVDLIMGLVREAINSGKGIK